MITTINIEGKKFEISVEGESLRAVGSGLGCKVSLESDNKILVEGYKMKVRVRLSEEKYNLLLNALRAARPESVAVEFVSHLDLETGITWFTLKNRISRQAWGRVAHLFASDVELDCPEGREWNDSITLRWATHQPEMVRNLLS